MSFFFFSEYNLRYFSEVENCGSKTKTCYCFPKECVLWVSGQSEEIERVTELLKVDIRKDYFHILHLLQDRYSPGDLGENFERKDSTKFSEFKVSAADLHNAGVEFLNDPSRISCVSVTEPKGICSCFRGVRFKIPSLLIHERTEVFLRNLIALEQCCPKIPRHFTSYAKVMSMLINSEKDVQVLKDAGIIHNYLGTDKDVPDLFDKLCKGVTVPGDLYLDACQQVIEYYKRRYCLPMTMRYWTRLIFTSTWGVVAFALGIITSLITVAQFVKDFRK